MSYGPLPPVCASATASPRRHATRSSDWCARWIIPMCPRQCVRRSLHWTSTSPTRWSPSTSRPCATPAGLPTSVRGRLPGPATGDRAPGVRDHAGREPGAQVCLPAPHGGRIGPSECECGGGAGGGVGRRLRGAGRGDRPGPGRTGRSPGVRSAVATGRWRLGRLAWTPDPSARAGAIVAARELGMELADSRRVRPYAQSREHRLEVYAKVVPTPARFPRRAGIARKRPLSNAGALPAPGLPRQPSDRNRR